MIRVYLSLFLLITLTSFIARAHEMEDGDLESQDILLVEQGLQRQTEMTDSDIFDELSELSSKDEAIATPELLTESPSACLSNYKKRLKQLLRKSIINAALAPPGIAGATLMVGSYGGSHLGSILTGSKGYGAILGSAWGAVIMFYGSAAFFTAREAILITEYIQLQRMLILLDEIHSEQDPIHSLTLLNKLHSRLQKSGSQMTLNELKETLLTLDQQGSFCDGSLRGNTSSTKLNRRLVGFHRLFKILSTHTLMESLKP